MTTRLLNTIKTDVMVQARNNLYTIGIMASVLVAFLLFRINISGDWGEAIPLSVLLLAGGSTLLYVAGMILFEKDEGTINALIVSPLRTGEYLLSKVVTLSALATFEILIVVGLTASFGGFNVALMVLGTVAMSVFYTLLGIILIVRFKSITDFLVPVIVLALVLQLPVLYFTGISTSPLLLLIPTSAPTMIVQGAWASLEAWQWAYALAYTALSIIIFGVWARSAFQTHIIAKVG